MSTMKTKTLIKIYFNLSLTLVVLVTLTAAVGLAFHWTFSLWFLIVGGLVFYLQKDLDQMVKRIKYEQPISDLVDETTKWAAQAFFGYECAKRVVDQFFTPEEMEGLYDAIQRIYRRVDRPALPCMQELNMKRMEEKGVLE